MKIFNNNRIIQGFHQQPLLTTLMILCAIAAIFRLSHIIAYSLKKHPQATVIKKFSSEACIALACTILLNIRASQTMRISRNSLAQSTDQESTIIQEFSSDLPKKEEIAAIIEEAVLPPTIVIKPVVSQPFENQKCLLDVNDSNLQFLLSLHKNNLLFFQEQLENRDPQEVFELLNKQDSYKFTILGYAAAADCSSEIISYLRKKGAQLFKTYNETPLEHLILKNNDSWHALLEGPVDISFLNDALSKLCTAGKHNVFEKIEALLQAGASLTQKPAILHAASSNKHISKEAFSLLLAPLSLQHRRTLFQMTYKGLTPLETSARSNMAIDTFLFLVEESRIFISRESEESFFGLIYLIIQRNEQISKTEFDRLLKKINKADIPNFLEKLVDKTPNLFKDLYILNTQWLGGNLWVWQFLFSNLSKEKFSALLVKPMQRIKGAESINFIRMIFKQGTNTSFDAMKQHQILLKLVMGTASLKATPAVMKQIKRDTGYSPSMHLFRMKKFEIRERLDKWERGGRDCRLVQGHHIWKDWAEAKNALIILPKIDETWNKLSFNLNCSYQFLAFLHTLSDHYNLSFATVGRVQEAVIEMEKVGGISLLMINGHGPGSEKNHLHEFENPSSIEFGEEELTIKDEIFFEAVYRNINPGATIIFKSCALFREEELSKSIPRTLAARLQSKGVTMIGSSTNTSDDTFVFNRKNPHKIKFYNIYYYIGLGREETTVVLH